MAADALRRAVAAFPPLPAPQLDARAWRHFLTSSHKGGWQVCAICRAVMAAKTKAQREAARG